MTLDAKEVELDEVEISDLSDDQADDQDDDIEDAGADDLNDAADDVETDADDVKEPSDTEDDEEYDIVSIGDEAVDDDEGEVSRAPEWVRDLRKKHREEKQKRKELEAKLAEREQAPQAAELGKKPTLEAAEFDTAKYEEQLAAWYEKKREHDAQEAARKAEEAEQEKAWAEKLEGYQKAKTSLKVRDYDDAEEVVQDNLSATQQGMILQGAENPALLVYALGKNPKRASELGSISDPVKFAFAVARLETQLKVGKKKAASKPERVVAGTGRSSGSVDSTLERLREEAGKTGDFTKVREYKRKRRET